MRFQITQAQQTQPDSNSVLHESMRQGINTISFGQAIDLRRNLSRGLRTELRAGQYAIYNRAVQENHFITNNLWSSFLLNKQFSRFLSWDNYFGYQSFVANQTRMAQTMSGITFSLPANRFPGINLNLRGGLANDKRIQFDDSGWKSEAGIQVEGRSADSTVIWHAAGGFAQSRPGPRKNQRLLAEAGAEQVFAGGGLLAAEAVYLRHQVEDYLQRDIQSIKSDTVLGRVRIRIPLGRSFTFSSNNVFLTPNRSFFYLRPQDRKEERNVRYFQDEFESLSSLLFRSRQMQVLISFESRLRNRTYDILNRLSSADPFYLQQLNAFNQQLNEERIKDIREQFSTYLLDGRLKLSRQHSLRASFTGQLLRVDTRSELNNQDRDELLYAGELSHDWQLPFGFRLSNKFSGSFRHLIFIKAGQSSENYTDRIIRWEPSLRWAGRDLSWNGSMGIWATYQVRDFENQQDKNRSNRVLLFQHSIDYRLSGRSGVIAELLRRENRLSQFNWKDFSESPIDTVVLHDLAFRYRFHFRGLALQAGYRAFWQVRKSRASLPEPGQGASLIYLRSYFVQQGPQIRLLRESGGRLRLQGELWLQWTSQFFRYSKSNLPYLGGSVSAEQLARRENRILPFFNLQMVWLLHKPGKIIQP